MAPPRVAARLLRRGLLSALPVVALLFGLAAPVAAQTSATVSVSAPTNANEGNSGTKFKYFTVKLSRAVSQNVTAKICYSGTATRGASADYQLAVFGAVHNSNCWNTIINGGQTSSTIIGIRIRGDTDPESDETVVATLSLTNPPPGVTLGTSTATYTILNDDEDTRPVATITRQSATVTEGTRAGFWLSVTPAPDADLKVNTTRTQSGDFFRSSALRNHPISYVVGLRRGEFYPPSLDDSVDEPDGSMTVTLASGTGYKVGSPSTATIAVRDNDPTIVSLARVGSGAVTEGDKVELTVTLGRALVAGETIDVPLAIGGTNVTTGDWSLGEEVERDQHGRHAARHGYRDPEGALLGRERTNGNARADRDGGRHGGEHRDVRNRARRGQRLRRRCARHQCRRRCGPARHEQRLRRGGERQARGHHHAPVGDGDGRHQGGLLAERDPGAGCGAWMSTQRGPRAVISSAPARWSITRSDTWFWLAGGNSTPPR